MDDALKSAELGGLVLETVGRILRNQRETRRMSLAEVSRITRIPVGALSSIEGNQFDNLPGEVFVRGFLKAYAGSVGLDSAEIVARYTAHRRAPLAIPMPLAAPVRAASPKNRRVGVAVACVLLLVLFTLAVSIVMKPRGHDMPQDLSQLVPAADSVTHQLRG